MMSDRGTLLRWAAVLAAVPLALIGRWLFLHWMEQTSAAGGPGRCLGQIWTAVLGAGVAKAHVDVCISAPMRAVQRLVERVAPTSATALIVGESGVGKETVARSIHARSPRAGRPFIKLNCAALAHALLESELFGHEKGAFTHAIAMRRGWFEQAHGGTLLLDEITELPLELQAKLLHVLQDGEFFRVGGQRPLRADVHVIAATNRDLPSALAAGEFREDLYYRLNVIEIRVPPLRERKEDIPPLVEHFGARFGVPDGHPVEVSEATLAMWMRHDWPGNVRELENAVQRLAVLGSAAALDQTLSAVQPGPARGGEPEWQGLSLRQLTRLAVREAERAAIMAALDAVQWNRSAAARRLQISKRTLRYRVAHFGLEEPR